MDGIDGPFQLRSTTRYDPYLQSVAWNNDPHGPSPFFLLPLHLERLLAAAEKHSWLFAKSTLKYAVLKGKCLDAIADQRVKGSTAVAFRVQITLSVDGQLVVVAAPLPEPFRSDPTELSLCKPPSINLSNDVELLSAIKVYMDTEATQPSIFTQTKTTLRDVYDRAKKRHEQKGKQTSSDWDVLLYNQDGEVMEASIFNMAFYRSSAWVTPSLNTGCLAGVMRRWLLEKGRIIEDTEGTLTKDTVQAGEWVLLFNGVRGCRLGKIYL
jgi:4-amino-4-deoxychorismate lyase